MGCVSHGKGKSLCYMYIYIKIYVVFNNRVLPVKLELCGLSKCEPVENG